LYYSCSSNGKPRTDQERSFKMSLDTDVYTQVGLSSITWVVIARMLFEVILRNVIACHSCFTTMCPLNVEVPLLRQTYGRVRKVFLVHVRTCRMPKSGVRNIYVTNGLV
jgi:hypothetical protein